jgi:glycosyltransferase involved in cell wall biosynthesis
MRIAYVTVDPGVPVFGRKGCSVHVQGVLAALLARGDDVELFTPRRGGESPEALRRVAVREIKSYREKEEDDRHTKKLARMNEQLFAQLKEAGPFDAVYERYSLWSYGAMEYARGAGIPGILEVNAPLVEEQAKHRGLVHPESAREVARRVFAAASTLIPVSEEVGNYLVEHGADPSSVHVVYNGVDPQRFVVGREARAHRPFTVGFVGTLKPWHGLTQLVEAFAALRAEAPECRLRVVGDGPGREQIENALSEHGASDAADLVGAVDPTAVPGELQQMDVTVAPYSAEGFYFSPLKVYEAMAAGVPVVASRVGQVARVIDDGVTGLLCEPDDAASMARQLKVLHGDAKLRDRMGAAARDEIFAHHTWPLRVKEIFSLAGA